MENFGNILHTHVVQRRPVDVHRFREPDPAGVALQLGLLGRGQQSRFPGGRLKKEETSVLTFRVHVL